MTVGSVLNASRVTLLPHSQKGGIWVKDREARGEEGGRGEQQNNTINTCCLLCRQTSETLTWPEGKKRFRRAWGPSQTPSVYSQDELNHFFLYIDNNGCIQLITRYLHMTVWWWSRNSPSTDLTVKAVKVSIPYVVLEKWVLFSRYFWGTFASICC